MERETGIEPASLAWEAIALPLSYPRRKSNYAEFYIIRNISQRRRFAIGVE